jgi:hypothetical protein
MAAMSSASAPAPEPERNAPAISPDDTAWLTRELSGIHDPSDPGPPPHVWAPKPWAKRARCVAGHIVRAAMRDEGDRATVDVMFDLLVTAIKEHRR